jgi:hypothetical protein
MKSLFHKFWFSKTDINRKIHSLRAEINELKERRKEVKADGHVLRVTSKGYSK